MEDTATAGQYNLLGEGTCSRLHLGLLKEKLDAGDPMPGRASCAAFAATLVARCATIYSGLADARQTLSRYLVEGAS